MNTIVKTILWIGGGIVVGSGAGYCGMKLWDKYVQNAPKRPENGRRSGWTPPAEEEPEPEEEPDRAQNKHPVESEHPHDSDEYDGEVSEETEVKMRNAANERPRIITEDDYNCDSDFDKITGLKWFPGREVLLDEIGEAVHDPDRFLGEDVMRYLRSNDLEEGQVIYVRDICYGKDYVIMYQYER
jgi:hypothetical protein